MCTFNLLNCCNVLKKIKLFYLYTPLNLLCKEMRCLNKIIIIIIAYANNVVNLLNDMLKTLPNKEI